MDKIDIKKKEQELNRLTRQMQRDSEKLRKKRTHLLIQKGALLEKYFNLYDNDVEETEKYLQKIKLELEKNSDSSNL